MPGGFNNPILGGDGGLVRATIKSPDYVPGVAGWAINKDGSAEFNDVIFRGSVVIDNAGEALLVYDGTPALGNLILAIASTNGSDAFGNVYFGGLNQFTTATTPTATHVFETASADQTTLYAQDQDFNILHQPASATGGTVNVLYGPNSAGIRLGSAEPGQYYAEQVNCSAQGIVSGVGATRKLVGLTNSQLSSDYGSAFTTGDTWTCPVSGWYEHTLSCGYQSWLAGSASAIAALVNGTKFLYTEDVTSQGDCHSTSVTRWFTIGDTVQYFAGQTTGSTRVLFPDIRSCVTVRRHI